MLLPDVNVLVYAFRREHARHKDYRAWLEQQQTFAELSGPRNIMKATYTTGSE